MKSSTSNINTLRDIEQSIRDHAHLDSTQKAELCSGIRTFSKVVGRDPSEILADPGVIRVLSGNARWQVAGIRKRSWANVRSRLLTALRTAGVKVDRSRRNFPNSAGWEGLLERAEFPNGRRDLTRFAGYCTLHGIEPQDVTEETFAGFLRHLELETLQKNPRERWNVARRAWNRGAESVPGWPEVLIPGGQAEGWRGLAWAAFPESLQDEIKDYTRWLKDSDPFNERRKLRPVTAAGYLQKLRSCASRLTDAGVPVQDLQHVSDLLRPPHVKLIMRQIVGSRDLTEATASASAHMTALLSLASFAGVADADMLELRAIAKKVRHRPEGMCRKNKERLGVLSDKDVQYRLLTLPFVVAERVAGSNCPSLRDAQAMQMAALLELTFRAPMRVSNLAALDLERNIARLVHGAGGEWRISVPASQVKNGVALDFVLPLDTSRLLDLYVRSFRPLLAKSGCTALFPSQTGTQKGSSALSKQFSGFLKRELGVEMHIHLTRHHAAFLHLDANPGDYETVRRLLGHRQINTTIKFYAGTETEKALAFYDRTIDRLRAASATRSVKQ